MHPILPRTWLFGHPEKSLPKISPNGQYISYLAPEHNYLRLQFQYQGQSGENSLINLIDLNQSTGKNTVNYSIKDYEWAFTNQHIIYWHDDQGDENWCLYAIHLTTQQIIQLTPPKCQAKIIKLSSSCPDTIAILINNRNRALFDVCLVNIHTGELKLIYENQDYIDIYVDEYYTPKIGIKPNSDGTCRIDHLHKINNKIIATPFTVLSQLDFMGQYMFKENRIGLNATGQAVFFSQSIESDKAQLVRFDLNDFTKTIIACDQDSDYQDIILAPHTREPIAVAFNYHVKTWKIVNVNYQTDMTILLNYRPDHELAVLSQSQDNTLWLISYHSDIKPPEYCLYSTQTQAIQHLFFSDTRFSVNNVGNHFASQHCLSIQTKDNLNIPCYLSLPSDSAEYLHLHTHSNVPLILWLHGGPNSRDFWGFNPIHQWLTNRGYAVLSINFRGSTGFGRAFLEAGNGEWGGKIAEDIKTCAEWVAEKYTIINSSKIAIMGRSFGGYAALMGLAKYPDFYACGVDWVGPTNLNDFLRQIPPYWNIVYNMLKKMVGETPEHRLAHSPDQFIHALKKPLFKAHGAQDVQINQNGADIFIEKLTHFLSNISNISNIWYGSFPNEGHTFIHENNKIAFYALVEAFAAKHLGGKLEPIQDEIKNSTFMFQLGELA